MGLGDLNADKTEEDEAQGSEVVASSDGTLEVETAESAQGDNTLIQPAGETEEVVKLYKKFEEIKTKLLDSGDTSNISGSSHINKSGWRKIATAFNLSVETRKHRKWVEDGVVKAEAKAQAVAPNGKKAIALGLATSTNSNFMDAAVPDDVDPSKNEDYLKIDGKWRRIKDPRAVDDHNLVTLAETRAKNRAISDCVGGGEVSAEEITAEDVL